MTKNKELMNEIQGEISKGENRFSWLGFILSVISILHGHFIFTFDGYFLNNVEPYFQNLPEGIIGRLFFIGGIIKLIGVLLNNKPLKRYGIWALTGLWWMQFGLAWGYSFGTGYPNPTYIYMLGFAATSAYEARRGSFY